MEMEDVDALLRDIDAYTSSRKKPDPQGPPLGRQTSTLGEQFVLAYPIQAPMLAQAGAHTQPIEYNSRAFHLTETQSSNWKDLPLDAYGTLTISHMVFPALISNRSSAVG